MKYRPDIDGLRALAVLPVLLYHAGLPAFTGGYIGVDIFFVISGFLITGIVSRELANRQFSLINFYERRARRILPALVLVVLASYIVGWVVLLPGELEDLGKSGTAAALFVSNIYFGLSTDYFATSAEYDPLLHTWSLAVEEQFYLAFPPLLMVLYALSGNKAALWITILLSIGSFVCTIAMLPSSPSWVFYLIPFRAWELGIGAILALGAWSAPNSRIVREIAGIIGLTGITLPVFLYDTNTMFPGISAVPPVLGAALLILIGGRNGGSFVTSILSNRMLVGVGLISYSLYLWHWPILSYLRVIYGSTELPLIWGITVVPVSIVLAWLSWKYVEGPFRARPPRGLGRAAIFGISAFCLTSISVVGVAAYLSNGFSSRLSPDVLEIAAVSQDRNPLRVQCLNSSPNLADCAIGLPADNPEKVDFVFWGDSHADAIAPAVSLSAENNAVSGVFIAHSACPPIFFVERQPANESCQVFLDDVRVFLESNSSIPLIVMHARWPLSVEGTRYAVDGETAVHLRWSGEVATLPDERDNAAIVEAGLRASLLRLARNNRSIVLLGPTPEINYNPTLASARAKMLGFSVVPAFNFELHQKRIAKTDEILQRVADEIEGVEYLPIADLICSQEICQIANDDGIPFFIDDDHLSSAASRHLLTTRLNQIWALGE
ncbi:MAG: acyltransferase family protein [Pseudomonadota bacterium]